MLVDMRKEVYKTHVKKVNDDESDEEDCEKKKINTGTEREKKTINSGSGQGSEKRELVVSLPTLKTSKNASMPQETSCEEAKLSSTMEDNQRANTSLCRIPFNVTRDLMGALDTDDGWQALAAEAEYNFEQIQQLGLRRHQPGGSPTKTLLWELGCQGYTLGMLHARLAAANRRREMGIIQRYVNATSGAACEKKDSLLSSMPALPSSLNQLRLTDQGSGQGMPETNAGAGFVSNQINFNSANNSGMNATKAVADKHYDDKQIPGASFTTNRSINRSASEMPPNNQPIESSDRPGNGHKSLPVLPGMSGHGNSPVSSGGGTDRVQEYLRNLPQGSLINNSQVPNSGNSSTTNSNGTRPSLPQHLSNVVQNRGEATNIPSANSSQPNSIQSEVDKTVDVIPSFTYEELHKATGGFSEQNILGKGAFGTVYLGMLRHTNCAIKKYDSIQYEAAQVKAEMTILFKYQNENIVTMYGCALNGPDLCLVYQYLVNGSLEDRLCCKNGTPPLDWERRLNILVGACNGLNFLHTMGNTPLIHGDIKSANILLDRYLEAKLGDLGQASHATGLSQDTSGFTHITHAESSTKLFGTKAYQPPEIDLSTKGDVYAMGVVTLEVCSGQSAYDINRNPRFLADVFNQDIKEDVDKSKWPQKFQDTKLVNVPDNIFIEVLTLGGKCVNRTKKLRPDSARLLKAIKKIYEKYKEAFREEYDYRMTSTESYPSFPPHLSLAGCSNAGFVSRTQQEVQRMQEEQLQLYNSQMKNVNLQRNQAELRSNPLSDVPGVVERRKETAVVGSPDSPINSFREGEEIPVPFKLQQAYDLQPVRKKIERLSAIETPTTQEPRSDEQSSADIKPLSEGEQNSEVFPKADPKKMAQLMKFDNAQSPDFTDTDLKCDSKKMAYLQNFDNNGCNSYDTTTSSLEVQSRSLLSDISESDFNLPQPENHPNRATNEVVIENESLNDITCDNGQSACESTVAITKGVAPEGGVTFKKEKQFGFIAKFKSEKDNIIDDEDDDDDEDETQGDENVYGSETAFEQRHS